MFLNSKLVEVCVIHDTNNISIQVNNRIIEVRNICKQIDNLLSQINYATIISYSMKEEINIIHEQIMQYCYIAEEDANQHNSFTQQYYNLLTILSLVNILVDNYIKVHNTADIEHYRALEDTMLDIIIVLNSTHIIN